MSINTAINGLPLPDLTDPANIATSVQPLGQALDSLLVARFASTTARDTAITAPTAGMVCYVTGTNTYYVYNGSSWTTLYGMQKGSTTMSFTTQSAVTQAVVFPIEFINVPVVIVTINSGAGVSQKWGTRPFSVTTTGFTIWATSGDGTTHTWSNVPIDWVAIGI